MEITIRDLTHSFEGRTLFHKLSFTFQEGQFYFLKGNSGCGKSTLLKLIVNLYRADEGGIEFSEKLDPVFRRKKVQLLPQLPVIISGTVEENLLWPFSLPVNQEDIPDSVKIEATLARFFPEGISSRKDAETLSQGQKQRLAVARVLLLNPEVLLCDEPTSALDKTSREIVDKEINNFFQSDPKKTVVYISHHPENFVENARKKTLNLTPEGFIVS